MDIDEDHYFVFACIAVAVNDHQGYFAISA
jgi:hypothetical protein